MRVPALLFLAALFGAAPPAAAQQLPGIVRPDHYDLSFIVDLQHERFEATATIRVHTSQPTDRVVMNALDLQIREVMIGAGPAAQKATVAFDPAKQTVTFTVANAIPKGAAE